MSTKKRLEKLIVEFSHKNYVTVTVQSSSHLCAKPDLKELWHGAADSIRVYVDDNTGEKWSSKSVKVPYQSDPYDEVLKALEEWGRTKTERTAKRIQEARELLAKYDN